MNPHYTRVIPRDLFNEANLLKCLGRVSLLILDNAAPSGIKLEYEPETEGFEVAMNEDDGSICVPSLLLFRKDGEFATPYRPMNSREQFPLWIQTEDDDFRVLDENGNFTPEFEEWADA